MTSFALRNRVFVMTLAVLAMVGCAEAPAEPPLEGPSTPGVSPLEGEPPSLVRRDGLGGRDRPGLILPHAAFTNSQRQRAAGREQRVSLGMCILR